ncbi:50S ribosomal protein L23 [Candidatus Saccharibacteria bacterium]|nr:50S ribosomal protein L23 [Candidatus Saccharibacteria bacterium]
MADKKTTSKSEEAVVTPTLLQPRATEKTYREQTKRTYAFFVKLNETKQEIAKRVASDYNVKVEDVRVLTRKGKKTKFSKGRHAYPGTTFRHDHKLAYVTLAEGNSIKVFEMPEESKVEEKPAKKAAKKADAKEAKTVKSTDEADKNAGKEK